MSTRELRCPSCDGVMNPVERQGVVIDLCRGCKGVFLDRGELDKMLDAVEAQQAPLVAEADRFSRRPDRDWDDDDDDHDRGRGRGQDGGGRGRKRRGGMLGDLFDFG